MNQPNTNNQTNQPFNQLKPPQFNQPINRPPCNQPRMNQPPALTEQRTKEIVMETLIELNLVPKPQKRKTVHV